MSTAFTWSARLVDVEARPVSGVSLNVEIFDLKANAWVAIANGATGVDGLATGRGAIEDDTLPLAPAMRLTADGAVMSAAPEIARAARGASLTIDFGQLQRLAVEARFAQPRTVTRGLRGAATMVGGVAASEAPSSARAELVERDAEIRRLRETVAATPAVDAAAIRAEAGAEAEKTFATRLAARDRDIADRDALLAERARAIADQQAEIARLRTTVAERDKAAETLAAKAALGATGDRTVKVMDFATTVATQLDDAQVALQPRGFSLGAIQVDAKAVLKDDGGRIELLGKEDLKALPARALSNIRLEFQPGKVAATGDGGTVPDVRDLTESAVRRVLSSVGLVLEASIGPRSLNPRAAAGQAMLQSPTPGEPIARGARVMVIFAGDDGQGA